MIHLGHRKKNTFGTSDANGKRKSGMGSKHGAVGAPKSQKFRGER